MFLQRYATGILFLFVSWSAAQNATTIQITTSKINTTLSDIMNVTTQITSMITTQLTTNKPNTTNETTRLTSSQANITTEPSRTTMPPTVTPTTQRPLTTTQRSGRKFDGFSFAGGVILTLGLTAIVFLVINYLRRTNRLPYSNLQ